MPNLGGNVGSTGNNAMDVLIVDIGGSSVKLWHTAGTDLTKIERAQVISCLPSTRGTSVFIDDE